MFIIATEGRTWKRFESSPIIFTLDCMNFTKKKAKTMKFWNVLISKCLKQLDRLLLSNRCDKIAFKIAKTMIVERKLNVFNQCRKASVGNRERCFWQS